MSEITNVIKDAVNEGYHVEFGFPITKISKENDELNVTMHLKEKDGYKILRIHPHPNSQNYTIENFEYHRKLWELFAKENNIDIITVRSENFIIKGKYSLKEIDYHFVYEKEYKIIANFFHAEIYRHGQIKLLSEKIKHLFHQSEKIFLAFDKMKEKYKSIDYKFNDENISFYYMGFRTMIEMKLIENTIIISEVCLHLIGDDPEIFLEKLISDITKKKRIKAITELPKYWFGIIMDLYRIPLKARDEVFEYLLKSYSVFEIENAFADCHDYYRKNSKIEKRLFTFSYDKNNSIYLFSIMDDLYEIKVNEKELSIKKHSIESIEVVIEKVKNEINSYFENQLNNFTKANKKDA